MSSERSAHRAIPFGMGMVLVTMGVVYGDIGTSPMYTLRAIMHGNGGLATMSPDVVIGALSLIIWTMTLITTVKYVLVAMKADNHNEAASSPCTAWCAAAAAGSSCRPWSAARPCLPTAS